jgi:zinc/manganese transport system substrate-binding protein
MRLRGSRRLAALCLMLAWCSQAMAAPPVRVVASFSILADIVREVGGGDVAVTSLIGPDSDAHVFEPTAEQARLLAKAQLFVVNGLGFEGWLSRLTRSAQFSGLVVTAAAGITPITIAEPGETRAVTDPHAWQDPRNGIVYAENIAGTLAAIDPGRADIYHQRFGEYKSELEALDRRVRGILKAIPADKRRVITSHDAFAYYGQAYGVTFLAAEGLNGGSEPSAKSVAALIRQIRREHIKALFLENVADSRLVEELARETGTTPGPPLYSDALSDQNGPAPTYIRMIEYNTAALEQGMLKN